MRLLPIAALVLASLVFSVGGVAIVGRADSSADATGQSPAVTPQPQVVDKCAPKHFEVRPANPARMALPSDAVPLNTRGYNYANLGDTQMDPTGRHGDKDAQPPVAPAPPAKP